MALPGLVRANNLNDVVDRERAWNSLGSSLATGDIAIPAPSLDLNFAANKSLVDDISGNNLITFSRASTGTFVGSNGLIQSAASGVPRFDHNPETGESLGLLVEEARTNSLLYSEQFDVGWGSSRSTQTPNTIASPDGTMSADSCIVIAGGFNGSVSQAISLTSGIAYTLSFHLKYKGFQYVRVGFSIENTLFASFDLQSGLIAYTGANVTASISTLANGWYRCAVRYVALSTGTHSVQFFPVDIVNNTFTTVSSTNGVFVWGAQLEAGAFPTSYIPTVASTVTRAADVASITGANFSSWWNPSEGTTYSETRNVPFGGGLWYFGPGSFPRWWARYEITNGIRSQVYGGGVASAFVDVGVPGVVSNQIISRLKYVVAVNDADRVPSASANGENTMNRGGNSLSISGVSALSLGIRSDTGSRLNGHISRFIYWPARLENRALQYITQPSISAINLYAFNYAINGKDVLALNAVRNASTRNFIFIKGLLSAAQPRLTTAAASTSSALALATNALPKLAPTSSGNYFFASGLTLSGVTTRINGTNALSIATSPFSGSTATAPLLFRELRPQANWRFTEPMPSGIIASPEFAIPFETNDFVLFMKAGQN